MSEPLLYEKYRPTNINDFIFMNDDLKNFVKDIVKEKNIPHLLFSGPSGTGKTTLAKVLINEIGIEKSDVKIINASRENGIEKVRDDITTFAQTFPFGKYRVVVLEEADGLSFSAQKALLSLIEQYSDTCRFIFTCNYPHKLLPALHSRTQHVVMESLDVDSVYSRVVEVLEKENIKIDEPEHIIAHVERFYPDMRKILNNIDKSSRGGKLLPPISGHTENTEATECWDQIWKNNPNREDLERYIFSIDNNNYEKFYISCYENVEKLPEELRDNAYCAIRDGLVDAAVVAYQPILLKATIIRIFSGI